MIPRRNLIAAGVLVLLALTLSVAWHDYTGLIVGAISFAAFVFFLRQRIRGSRSGSN